jgi:hypothetical protein
MVDPFKNEHPGLSSDKDGSTKEITIKINPTKIIKFLLVFVVLVVVFYAGRFSVDASSLKSFAGTGNSNVIVDKEVVEETIPEVVSNVTKDEPVEESTSEESTPEPTVEKIKVEEPKTTTTAAESYDKVTLTINEPYIDWKTTWGKITGFKITINNKETGFIEPARGIMLMEGYDDYTRNLVFPAKSSKIKAGEDHNTEVTVKDGFSYHPNSAGDLENVKVTLTFYDSNDKIIVNKMQELDLRGE